MTQLAALGYSYPTGMQQVSLEVVDSNAVDIAGRSADCQLSVGLLDYRVGLADAEVMAFRNIHLPYAFEGSESILVEYVLTIIRSVAVEVLLELVSSLY